MHGQPGRAAAANGSIEPPQWPLMSSGRTEIRGSGGDLFSMELVFQRR